MTADQRPPNVFTEVYDTAVLCYLFPEWPALDKAEKLALLREHIPSPAERGATHNTTCVGLHEFLAATIDPDLTPNETVSHLALGSNSTTPAANNKQLNAEIDRTEVTDSVTSGPDVTFETFIDSSEFNGTTLRELGLFSGPDTDSTAKLLNHSLISPEVNKTNSKTVIFSVTLSFSAA